MIDYTEDILYRDEDVNKIKEIIDLIKKHEKNSFIMIDGEWGSGKTTLINMIENEVSQNNNIIKYNCWENSYYNDPLAAILSIMYDTIQDKKMWTDEDRRKLEKIIKLPLYLLSFGSSSMFNISLDLFNEFNQGENKTISSQINEIRKYFKTMHDNTTILIVDELDRCLPEYAIKVLERLYLIFKDIPNVIILIANNKKQLRNSIKHIYGEDIDVDEYLKKFIDETYTIDYKSVNVNNLYKKYEKYFQMFENIDNDIMNVIAEIFSLYAPREQENLIKKMIKAHDSIFDNKIDFYVCLSEILIVFVGQENINKVVRGYTGKIPKVSDRLYDIIRDNYEKLEDNHWGLGVTCPKSNVAKSFQIVAAIMCDISDGYRQFFCAKYYNFIINYDNKRLKEKMKLFIEKVW